MIYTFADRDINEIFTGYVSWSTEDILHINYLAPTHSTYYTREDLLRMIDILDGKEEGMRTCDECDGTKLWAPYGHSEPERETCCMCEGTGEIEDVCYCAARYSGECACNYTGWIYE